MLEVKELSFDYREREILKDISFTAMAGDFLCILGPNGAGKSTLFRCILGLHKRYNGIVSIHNENIKNMSQVKLAKKMAYIPQSHYPTFNFKVLDIVAMGLTVHLDKLASPTGEHEKLAYEALEQLGISYLWNRGYGEISGGERQMTLIARAVAQKSSILLMDEPTANLDYGNQIRVLEKVRELAQEGYTIIMTTHNPEHAFIYGNKMLMMQKGEITCAGCPTIELTEELIQNVYGVSVEIHEIYNGDVDTKVIVPKLKGDYGKNVSMDRREYSLL